MISDQCGPPRARHPPSNTFTITKVTHLLSRTAAFNSTLIALLVTALSAILAFPTAWALAKFPLRGRRAIELFVLAPVIVPGIVVVVGVGQLFQTVGIAYTVTGVVLAQTMGTLPLMIRLLVASFETLPDEL